MAKSVPVWLAVGGAAVGLGLGSLNLLEKVSSYFAYENPSISERYIIANVPIGAEEDANEFFTSDFLNLENAVFMETDLLTQAKSVMDNPEAIADICDNSQYWLQGGLVRKSFSGCWASSITVAFYGLRNNGTSDVTQLEVLLDRYFDPDMPTTPDEEGFAILAFTEEQAREFSDSEEQFQERSRCMMTFDRLAGSGECISYLVEEDVALSIPQPIRPGQTVFVPIYIGYSLSLDSAGLYDYGMYDTRILLPQSVRWKESDLIPEARQMSPVPIIRANTRIKEHG